MIAKLAALSNSRGTPRFWAAYRALPEPVRDAARKVYQRFRENPHHPSLQFLEAFGNQAERKRLDAGHRFIMILP